MKIFALLSNADTFEVHPENMWKKVKGHQKLRGQQLAVLQSVSAWRETSAMNRNKPRRRIVSDDALIDMCKQKPENTKQLLSLRSLNKSRISQHEAENAHSMHRNRQRTARQTMAQPTQKA